MEIKYVMIYDSNGIPLYSRCFSNICNRAVKDDILFSAFLTALETTVSMDPKQAPQTMEINNQKVEVSVEGNNIKLKFADMDLVFFKSTQKEYTIALGVSEGDYRENRKPISQFFGSAHRLVQGEMGDKNWGNLSMDQIKEFEHKLLDQAIRPFFDLHRIDDTCKMGENCPFRVSVYDNQQNKSIMDRLKATVDNFRSGSMMQRIKSAVSGVLFPLRD